jgi:hypothetical protein
MPASNLFTSPSLFIFSTALKINLDLVSMQ